jgi:outer membrane protein
MLREALLSALIVCAPAAAEASGLGADSLTVERAVHEAISNHPLVEQASEAIRAARARIGQTRSAYYPFIEADLSYARIGPVPELVFPGLGSFKLFPENNYDEHLALSQTVWDFGKTDAAVSVGRSGIRAARDNLEFVKTNLAFATIQSFYAVLFLRQSIAVQDQQIDALEHHLSATKERLRAGTVTDFDVLTTQVRIAAAQSRKVDLRNNLEKQEAAFRRLVGLSQDEQVLLSGSFHTAPVSLSGDSLLAQAKDRRIELKQSADAERVAIMQERLASKRDNPAIRLNLEYGAKNGYEPNLDVQLGNWVLAIEARVPIFDGYLTGSSKREARANLRAAEAHTLDVERMVVAEVQQAISDARSASEKIGTTELQVEQAKQALDMANVRYESGVITNLDVIDAETALAEARLSYLQSLYLYEVSRYGLERAVGGNLLY